MTSVCKEQLAGRIICDKKIVRIFDLLISPLRVHALFIFILGTENIFLAGTSLYLQWKSTKSQTCSQKSCNPYLYIFMTTLRNLDALFQMYNGVLFVFVCILLVVFALET